MATTANILTSDSALLRIAENGTVKLVDTYDIEWQALNAELAIATNPFVVDSCYSLQVFPNDSLPVTIYLDQIASAAVVPLYASDRGRTLSFNARLYANSTVTVSTHLYIDGDSNEYTPHEQTFAGGVFTAIHSNRAVVPDTTDPHSAQIYIEVSNHNGPFFITLPHLIHDLAFYQNFYVMTSREFMPDFYFEVDAAQEYPTFPYHKFMDALFSTADDVYGEYRNIFEYENSELVNQSDQGEFWVSSSLVDPGWVNPQYASWLAQFTGQRELITNFFLNDGTQYFQNFQQEQNFITWQISNGYYGHAAGSRRAIAEAVRQVLIRTKDDEVSTLAVSVAPNYLNDPFAIKITTLTNETIDADAGEESAVVLASATLAKPLGYRLIHETVDEFFFTFDDPVLGILDEFKLG